jgi:hypothetical protein
MPTRYKILRPKAFPCTLGSPFDDPHFLPGSQLPGALWMARENLYSCLNGLFAMKLGLL